MTRVFIRIFEQIEITGLNSARRELIDDGVPRIEDGNGKVGSEITQEFNHLKDEGKIHRVSNQISGLRRVEKWKTKS